MRRPLSGILRSGVVGRISMLSSVVRTPSLRRGTPGASQPVVPARRGPTAGTRGGSRHVRRFRPVAGTRLTIDPAPGRLYRRGGGSGPRRRPRLRWTEVPPRVIAGDGVPRVAGVRCRCPRGPAASVPDLAATACPTRHRRCRQLLCRRHRRGGRPGGISRNPLRTGHTSQCMVGIVRCRRHHRRRRRGAGRRVGVPRGHRRLVARRRHPSATRRLRIREPRPGSPRACGAHPVHHPGTLAAGRSCSAGSPRPAAPSPVGTRLSVRSRSAARPAGARRSPASTIRPLRQQQGPATPLAGAVRSGVAALGQSTSGDTTVWLRTDAFWRSGSDPSATAAANSSAESLAAS